MLMVYFYSMKTTKILMVCLGNICRSPLAEGIMAEKLKSLNKPFFIDSAGTGGWHAGEPPDHRSIEVAEKYGIDISYRANIGKGLYIGHFGGIVIHGDAQIGSFCNLSQGMTIGSLARGNNMGIPKIGNRVFIGPGATILGGISIGDDVLIGTNAIVTFDVPNHSVVAAPLATIISNKGSSDYINNIQ